MFLVSGPALVVAQCTAGVLGALPSLNARPAAQLDAWLGEIRRTLAAWDEAHPDTPAAPWAVNLIVHRSNHRLADDLAVCARHRVPVVITSLGARPEVNDAVHAWGGRVLHDVTTDAFARKAVAKGADGLVAVAAGAGGHAGTVNPFALVAEIRQWFDGPLALAGAIATGGAVVAARACGADLAYVGTPFIATHESSAPPAYRQALVAATSGDIVYTDAFSGVPANYLAGSIRAAGHDPEALPAHAPAMDIAAEGDGEGPRAWRDIWSAGHGVSAVREVVSTHALVARLMDEQAAALRRLAGTPPDAAPPA